MHEVAITTLGSVIRQPAARSISRFIVYLSSRSLLRAKSIRRPDADTGLISVCNYNIREFHNRPDETRVAAHVYLTPGRYIYLHRGGYTTRNPHLNRGRGIARA